MAIAPDVIQRARARVGTVLNGKWRLERLLGIGGMAAVYAGVHRNQNRVAIKMLHPELSIDENVKTRFLREGYVANTVGHEGAPAVYDDDITPDGAAFLVMELLHGETLEDRAERKGGRLPPGEVLALGDQLLDVLRAAHERGVVHRDIKPDNLFLTTTGQLKVLDFGIARLRELTGGADPGMTGAGTFMGTPAFMSPEQARGKWDEIDARSDIWSVGATLFSLVSGRNVHESESVTEQLVLAATVTAPSLATVAPELPLPVIDLIDRALSYDKEKRWLTARAMQVALREAMAVVAPAADLRAPRPSLSAIEQDPDGDTLAAPPEVISDITGTPPRSGSLVSAVTSSPHKPPSQRRRSRFGVAIAGLLLGGIALAGVYVLRAPDEATEAPRAPIGVAEPVRREPAVERRAAPVPVETSVESAVSRTVIGADAGAMMTGDASAPRAHHERARGRGAARTAATTSASTAPQSVAPPATSGRDPFEKRY